MSKRWIALGLLLLGCGAVAALAQNQNRRVVPRNPGQREQVRLEGLEPAFRIEPLVHEFEAPRGRLLPFEFKVKSLRKTTSLRVRAVAMRQQDTGIIVPDTESPPPPEIRIDTPASMLLREDQEAVIRGRVTVPLSDSQFHSYGVLVTDLGQVVPGQGVDRPGEPEKRRVGIRFITQYLLRIDISVRGALGLSIRNVRMEGGEILDVEGRPMVRVWLSNPVDHPFEFQVRCHLTREGGVSGDSFPLIMPCRAAQLPPRRDTSRLLAHSRIRVEQMLPDPIFPGAYTLHAEIIAGRRPQLRASFPVLVRDGDFPAQGSRVVEVANAVSVTPPQIELSLRPGGDRFVPVTIGNNSRQTMDVQFAARAFLPSDAAVPPGGAADAEVDWLMVRPARMTLPPGRSRKVLIGLRAHRDLDSHRYGLLRVQVAPETGNVDGAIDLPVALMTSADVPVDLHTDAIHLETGPHGAAFVWPLRNAGAVHVPLRARLSVTDPFGRTFSLKAGFDRWLLPGRADQLRFRIPSTPPPGEYQLNALLEVPGGEPIVLEQTLEIEDEGG
ncbi:MAG: hypothetical protein ACREJB_07820 [Planctomycetaceae bacterium]